MNGLRETCHCGHDKSSHHFDTSTRPQTPCDCLATGCACKGYVNEFDPPPKKRLVRPAHPAHCRCYRCKEYIAQNPPPDRKTDPYPFTDFDD